jgi:hypothetical protein
LKISIKITQQISDCSTTWDNFLPPNHHLQTCHLQAFEQAAIDDIETNYVQVFLKDKLIGLVYLQQFRFRHKHLNFRKGQTALSNLIKIILPSQLRILVCGHLFRINFQGFYFKNPSHQSYIFDVIKQFIRQRKNCTPIGIMIKDCDDVFIEQRCKLFGYEFFNGDVTMELSRRPDWLSFDDYLNDLKKDYLKRAKKILFAFESIEKRELNEAAIIEQSADIERLYWNVVDKQIIKIGIVNTRYFYELKKLLQQNFEFHALYQQGLMVGFYTFIFYDHQMETHYIGLDYEANKSAKLYFNILFEGIKKMIERRDNKLELGRTAREAKANLGAMPKQIFNYIKISNPLAKIVVSYFLKKFNQREDHSMVQRNPLK